MIRVHLEPETARRLREAAPGDGDLVELIAPDGVVLMRATPPSASPSASEPLETEEDVRQMLERSKREGVTFSHAEAMLRLFEQEVRLEKDRAAAG